MTKIRNIDKELLSDNWYTLHKYSFDILGQNDEWQRVERETYDRGNGAAILLYDPARKTVILTRQFRMPTYINCNEDGMMIEVCAGLLDADNAEDCIRKEVEEETGYRVKEVTMVFQSYMSPGAVTEIIHFFTGAYTADMKVSEGGGLAHEHENIEVLELDFDTAYGMIATGEIIDGKTIMLLQHAKLTGLVTGEQRLKPKSLRFFAGY